MLKRISHRIVQKMNKVIPRTEEDCIKMEYMLEVILDQITILFVVFLLCSCMGYLRESLICFIGCMGLRLFAGGFHMKTRLGCCLATSSIVIGGGYLTRYVKIPVLVCIVLLIIDLFLVSLFAPQGTKNNPVNPKFSKVRKWESMIVICIDIVISIVFANGWAKGLAIGASLGTITILPIFNKESKLDLMNILREIKKTK